MPREVVMPQMGESVAEGTVTTWLKKVGEHVEQDEPLLEISTDKVDAEVRSPVAGVLLEVRAEEGQTVPVDTVVAVVGDEEKKAEALAEATDETSVASEDAEASRRSQEPSPPSPPPAAVDETSAEERRRTKSSPAVRKLATEHHIDISQLKGSGETGRVTKQDVLDAVQEQERPVPSDGGPSAQPPPSPAKLLAAENIPDAYRPWRAEGDRVEEMSTMRRKIAEHMALSRQTSAHAGTVWEIDFSRVANLRAQHKARWLQDHGVPLTFTAFVMKAVVDALKAYPIVNASIRDTQIVYHRAINLGLAVALDWGLIVPVVRSADELSLLGLARRAADLAERARSKKLKPEEVQDGTFTLTNPGIYGPLFGLPIINQPQAAVLALGGVEKRPVVVDDMIAIRTRAYTALSFDHRIIDGAVADQFMSRIKHEIEEFDEASF